MTDSQKALTAFLLREAASTYANHGCNDFDLSQLIPDQAERDDLVRYFFEWNGSPEDYRDSSAPDYRLTDWMLMHLMADLVETS